MSNCQLIYVSRAIPGLHPEELFNIRSKAHSYNREHGITGAMCLAFGHFIQVLEGKPEEVNKLFCKIANDKRHERVTLLDYSQNKEAVFHAWSMKVINLDPKYAKESSVLVKYNNYGKFEPESWSGEKAVSFLSDLIRLLPGIYDE